MNLNDCNLEPELVVLLVDDDRNDQALFALAVAQTNSPMWVQAALGTRQATDYLEGKGSFADRNLHPLPGLVLLDLKMPLADGFEFLSWRQTHPQFASAPVVAFTSSEYHRDIERAIAMGAMAHIPKPLCFKELMQSVGDILALARTLPHVRR